MVDGRDIVPRVCQKEGGCYKIDNSQELGFQVV